MGTLSIEGLKLIDNVRKELKETDLIFMFLHGTYEEKKLLSMFLQSKTIKNILLLFDEYIFDMNDNACKCYQLDNSAIDTLKQLFLMYEFSDCFFLVSGGLQYGSLINYIKTGMMTEEEVFQVLLI